MQEEKKDIFGTLRSWIIQGYFREGQYVNTGELCQSLNVSQIPIREILIRLAERGLLSWEKKRGFKIASCNFYECTAMLQLKRTILTNAIDRLCPLSISLETLMNVSNKTSAYCNELAWTELSDLFLEYSRGIMTDFEFHIFQISYDRIHEYHRKIFTRYPDKISSRFSLLNKITTCTLGLDKKQVLSLSQEFIDDDIETVCLFT